MQAANNDRTNNHPPVSDSHTMPGLIMSELAAGIRSVAPAAAEASSSPAYSSSLRNSLTGSSQITAAATPQGAASLVSGPLHTSVANAAMSASSMNRGALRPAERLRLRDWLIRMIETKAIPGLYWMDKDKQIVKIPWKHAARHGWSKDKDACLFREWAIHTKKYDPETDSPRANPKTWKANFRCAINSLPDIEELREKGKSRGNDAYKVYRLHPKKSRRHNRDRSNASTCPRRPRKSSKPRSNREDKRHHKRASSLNRPQDTSAKDNHFTVPTINDALAEALLRKRMDEISADYLAMERRGDPRDWSVNVQCTFKPSSSSISRSMPHSPVSMKSPPPFPMSNSSGSSSTNSLASRLTPLSHSTHSSPCSTPVSTPATTPQSPPPPYPVAMGQRLGWVNFELRSPRPEYNQCSYGPITDSEDISDSDCSNLTDADIVDIVYELESPNNSPRCRSPMDGNNNMATTPNNDYWTPKTMEERVFFGNNAVMTSTCGSVTDTLTPSTGYSGASFQPNIKIEPDTYSAPDDMMCHGYSHNTVYNTVQHQDAYDGSVTYQQL